MKVYIFWPKCMKKRFWNRDNIFILDRLSKQAVKKSKIYFTIRIPQGVIFYACFSSESEHFWEKFMFCITENISLSVWPLRAKDYFMSLISQNCIHTYLLNKVISWERNKFKFPHLGIVYWKFWKLISNSNHIHAFTIFP